MDKRITLVLAILVLGALGGAGLLYFRSSAGSASAADELDKMVAGEWDCSLFDTASSTMRNLKIDFQQIVSVEDADLGDEELASDLDGDEAIGEQDSAEPQPSSFLVRLSMDPAGAGGALDTLEGVDDGAVDESDDILDYEIGDGDGRPALPPAWYFVTAIDGSTLQWQPCTEECTPEAALKQVYTTTMAKASYFSGSISMTLGSGRWLGPLPALLSGDSPAEDAQVTLGFFSSSLMLVVVSKPDGLVLGFGRRAGSSSPSLLKRFAPMVLMFGVYMFMQSRRTDKSAEAGPSGPQSLQGAVISKDALKSADPAATTPGKGPGGHDD